MANVGQRTIHMYNVDNKFVINIYNIYNLCKIDLILNLSISFRISIKMT